MRAFKIVLWHADWDEMRQRFVQNIFIMSHWKPCKLFGVRQDHDQLIDWRARSELVAQVPDCLVAEVVKRSKVAKGCWAEALVILLVFDAASSDQLVERCCDQMLQILIDGISGVAHHIVFESIEGWVLG